MKVSVIIPVYNTKEYIRDCLDSVLQQPLQDIKVMRSVIKERYPKFYKSNVFKAMQKSRQIVAYLNYIGLFSFLKLLLNIKSLIKHLTLGEKF